MEHFIIDNHRALLTQDLSDNSSYVTAGPLYSLGIRPHYSGNFWMAKCSYINTLPRIDSLNTKDRMQAEFWIGMGPDFREKHKDCFDLRRSDKCIGLWQRVIPLEEYRSLTTCHRP